MIAHEQKGDRENKKQGRQKTIHALLVDWFIGHAAGINDN
jgi:hypothetical protein